MKRRSRLYSFRPPPYYGIEGAYDTRLPRSARRGPAAVGSGAGARRHHRVPRREHHAGERSGRGAAIGAGFTIVAFEFEYASSGDDPTSARRRSRRAWATCCCRRRWPSSGSSRTSRPAAASITRAGEHGDTGFGFNTGGGVKISLVGPLRLRVDYRVFKLGSGALYSPAHRVYAGLNLKLLSYLPRSETSDRLTMFWPDAYASAYFL